MVCWATGGLVKSEKRWTAEEEPHTRDCDPDDGVGDECASAGSGPEYYGTQCIRVHTDGSGSDEDRGDSIRAQRPQFHFLETRRRDQQFPIPPPLRE